MENDIKPAESPESTPVPPAQGGISSFLRKKLPSKLFPFMTVGSLIGIAIAAFVIGFAIAWSMIKWREPAPVTYAGGYGGGTLGCYMDDDSFIDTTTALYGNAPTDPAGFTAAAEAVISKVGDANRATLSQTGNKNGLIYLIKKSYNAGINPAILISFWAGESGFKDSGTAFGCALGSAAADNLESQIDCAITPVKQAINNESPYDAAGKPPGDKSANRWDRLLSSYAMDPMQQRYTNFKYTTTESDSRITILKQLVPDQVVCRSAAGASGILTVKGMNQKAPEWNPPHAPNNNIGHSGCAFTSVAMIDQYFGGSKTPLDIAPIGAENYINSNSTFSLAEPKKTIMPGDDFPKKWVSDQIKQGHPIMMRIHTYPVARGSAASYKSGHYLVIVGISEDGEQLYIQDPDGPQPHQNNNPPFMRPSDPKLYGVNDDGTKFQFWATKRK